MLHAVQVCASFILSHTVHMSRFHGRCYTHRRQVTFVSYLLPNVVHPLLVLCLPSSLCCNMSLQLHNCGVLPTICPLQGLTTHGALTCGLTCGALQPTPRCCSTCAVHLKCTLSKATQPICCVCLHGDRELPAQFHLKEGTTSFCL